MAYNQIYQPITIDPMGAYQAGQEMRQQRQQADRANALADYEAENTDQLMSGDRNAWAGYARAGGGIGNALAGMKATQPAAINPEEQFKRMKIVADVLGKVQTPEDFQAGEDWLVQNRIITPQDAEGYSFADLPRLQAMAQEALKPTADIQNYEYGKANPGFNDWRKTEKPQSTFRPATPEEAAQYGAKAGQVDVRTNRFYPHNPPSGMSIESDGQGGFSLTQGPGAGGGGFGRKVSNELEGKYAESYDLHSRLDRVGEIAGIDPATGRMAPDAARMLTYKGQAEDWIATQAEKLGVEPSEVERQAIEKRARFTTSVEQLFNAYRKEITGAAAAVQELERLKKSFINMDMSPTQFEAAYSEYRRELQRAMRISAKLRREGIDPASKEGGDIMDRLYLGGADDTPADRFGELAASGMDEDAIYQQLQREGY